MHSAGLLVVAVMRVEEAETEVVALMVVLQVVAAAAAGVGGLQAVPAPRAGTSSDRSLSRWRVCLPLSSMQRQT